MEEENKLVEAQLIKLKDFIDVMDFKEDKGSEISKKKIIENYLYLIENKNIEKKYVIDLFKEKGFVIEEVDGEIIIKNFEKKKEINIKETINNVYESITDVLKDYLDLPDNYYPLIAVWIIGTYFHENFETYPFLFFNAMRGSGKTRALKLISKLGNKGDGSVLNNITESALFHTKRGTTTCIDEIEQIGSKDKQTLRELLNSAYKKGTKVKRMKKIKDKEGERYVEESFEPYFPVSIANIWGLEEVLQDRAITLILEKSNNPFFTKKTEDFDMDFRFREITTLISLIDVVSCRFNTKKNIYGGWNNFIREKYKRHNNNNNNNNNNDITTSLNSLVKSSLKDEIKDIELEAFYNKIDEIGISGRNFELCFPLLLIANMINEELFNKILIILRDIVKDKSEEEFSNSKDVSLYDFVAQHGKDDEFVFLKDITSHFRLFVGDTGNEENWVNEKWMGRALKRLRLIKSKRREISGRMVILDVKKAKEKILIFKI
jgi:hypothetical protein